jgi:hypothetical protein
MLSPKTFLLFFLLSLAGCSTTIPINSHEIASVRDGRRSLVLLRITPGSGQPSDEYKHLYSDLAVVFASGDFTSGGVTKTLRIPRSLSKASDSAGWTCLLLEPGDYYLAFDAPERFHSDHPVTWHLAVPGNTPVLYVGTFQCPGKTKRDMFTTRYELDPTHATLSDESPTARSLLSATLPQLPAPETLLLQRQETGPRHLHAPLTTSSSAH